MSRRSDPAPLGELIGRLLQRYGVGDLTTWNRIRDEWGEVAPSPWDRHSRPLSLTRAVLVVEATTPSAVSLLRYGVASLESALKATYGDDVVEEIKVRGPVSERAR